MEKKILRILLKHYTKIGLGGGIAKVIFDEKFEDIAEEIVKLFAIPDVSNCRHNFKPLTTVGEVYLVCTKCNGHKGYC